MKRNAVCLAADARMLVPALFVADSVRRHSVASGADLDVFVYTTPEDAEGVRRPWLEERGIRLRTDLDTTAFADIHIVQDRLSAATLMRLLIPRQLRDTHGRVLYLDADLTIHGDVSPLFALDLAGSPLAAVRWRASRVGQAGKFDGYLRFLGMEDPLRHVNAGVLYIDVEQWLCAEVGTRLLEFLDENGHRLLWTDEDALNVLFEGRIRDLSPVWNMRPVLKYLRGDAARWISPVVRHYAGTVKPWTRFGPHSPFFDRQLWEAARMYRTFLRGSPWRGWLDEQWSARDLRSSVVSDVTRFIRWLARVDDTEGTRVRFREHWARYLSEASFVDVEQGITTWRNGTLTTALG